MLSIEYLGKRARFTEEKKNLAIKLQFFYDARGRQIAGARVRACTVCPHILGHSYYLRSPLKNE